MYHSLQQLDLARDLPREMPGRARSAPASASSGTWLLRLLGMQAREDGPGTRHASAVTGPEARAMNGSS